MKVASPKTPQEIRDLMCSDVSLAKDQHLLAILLAKGSRGGGRAKKNRSSIELAGALLELADDGLVHLVETVHAGDLDLSSFGIGITVGAPLIAGMELAHRCRRGFRDGGSDNIREETPAELRQRIFQRRGKPSEAELIAVILGASDPAKESAKGLVAVLGSPRQLVDSLTLDAFESFRKGAAIYLRLASSEVDVEVELISICRLVAAVELSRRYRTRRGPELPPLKVGAFGLESPVLIELLSPTSSVAPEIRAATIEVLRSHPEMASDFQKLDRLARDAGTSDDQLAIEFALTFELLRKHPTWNHPSEVLGEKIPYDTLLAIAQARIERSSKPPVRILKIKELLVKASQELPTEPIESFAEALAKPNLSKVVAERAIEKARSRYFEKVTVEQAGTA